MSKKFFILISFVLIFSIILPTFAQAADAFNVYPILYLPREIEFVSSDAAIQETDENLALLPTNLNEQSLHIISEYNGENNGVRYGVNIPINFTSDSQDLTNYSTSNLYLMNFEFEIYPLSFKSGSETKANPMLYKIIRNQGYDDETTYYPSGFGLESVSRYQPNADMSLFYKTTYIENPEYTDSSYGCYTFHFTMVIRLSSVASLKSLFFDIELSDLFAIIDEAIINIHPATTTKVVLSDLDDIDESITDLHETVADIYTLLSKIENDDESNGYLNSMNHYIQQTYGSITDLNTDLTNILNEFKDDLPGSVQDGVMNGLDDQKDKWEKEALDGMNNAVEDIQNELNIDISAIQNAFQNLYDSITTHDTNATLTFPAGKVTIGDTEYTFWEEAEIDFTQYFDYPIVQTLLIPLRFVIIIGFGYFMLGQVKKIESIVTMNSGGDDE